MKRSTAWLIGLCIASLLGSFVFAGVKVEENPWQFELRDAVTGSPVLELVNGLRVAVKRKTLAECKTAGEIEFRKQTGDSIKYRCNQVNEITYTGTCDDEAQPGPDEALEGTVDGEGFTIVGKQELTACLVDDKNPYDIRDVKWVKGNWRDKCWQKVETRLATCDGKLPPVVSADDFKPVPEGEPPPWDPDPVTGLGRDPAPSGCGPDDRQCGATPAQQGQT